MSTARLRQALRDPRLRRVATFTGKAAAGSVAAVAGLALGLHQVKRSLHLDDAKDLWREAAFRLHDPAAAAAAEARRKACAALLARLAAGGGLDVSDFQDAARRLHPVELELEELQAWLPGVPAAEAAAAEAALVERWRAAGYLSSTDLTRAKLFGRRNTGDAQGVDIRVTVPSYLMPEAGEPAARPATQSAEEREATVATLRNWGCALCRGALSREDVAQLRQALGLGSGSGQRRASEVGQWIQQHDPNIGMGRYSIGRLHCLLRGSPVFEPVAVSVHAAVAPLVHTFFREQQAAGGRVFLSEAQLIVADPLAETQVWHVDSLGGPGLSFFIPLADVPLHRGPQEVLPGSHHLHDKALGMRERWRRCLLALCDTHGAVSAASAAAEGSPSGSAWTAGDALVLDGRTLHRATTNQGLGAPVAALVLRYDMADTPPPGATRSTIRLSSHAGALLHAVFGLYAAV